ncbi:MAG: hypothetical protein ACPHRO_15520, partial [Nannocystaceae bacterium]
MPPEVLIVGDASNQRRLIRAVKQANYEVTLCAAVELEDRMAAPPPPAVAVLCVSDLQVDRVLSRIRRTRTGAAMPLMLFGVYGEEVPSMEDALDLGADFFLEDPIDLEVMREALFQLAGPPDVSSSDAPSTPAAPGDDIGRYADPPEDGVEPARGASDGGLEDGGMLDDAAGLDEALLDDAFSDSLEQEETSDVLKPPRLGEHPSASEFRLDLDEVDEEEGEGGSRRPDTDRGNGASGEAHEGAERGRHPGADDQRPRRRAHAPERGRLEDTCVPELLW